MTDLVSITGCAKVLNSQGSVITSQGLGKYCKAHDLIRGRGKGRGKPALVDVDEVIAHRKENFTREVMTGEASGVKENSDKTKTKPTLAIAANNPPPANDEEPALISDAQRKMRVAADMAELEYEQQIGLLTSINEVDAGIAELFSAQRTANKAVLTTWAERVLAELGLPAERLRQVRTLGRDLFRNSEEAFYTEAVKIADKTRQNETATRARLERLAGIAHRLRARDARKTKAK